MTPPEAPQYSLLLDSYEKLNSKVEMIKEAKCNTESLKKMLEMVKNIEGLTV